MTILNTHNHPGECLPYEDWTDQLTTDSQPDLSLLLPVTKVQCVQTWDRWTSVKAIQIAETAFFTCRTFLKPLHYSTELYTAALFILPLYSLVQYIIPQHTHALYIVKLYTLKFYIVPLQKHFYSILYYYTHTGIVPLYAQRHCTLYCCTLLNCTL